jgi:HK97 family phage major capsid protein
MAKLHELRRRRAELAAELRQAKNELRTKLEDLPIGDPEPTDVLDMHGRVSDLESQVNDHDDRIGKLEATQNDDGDGAEPVANDERAAALRMARGATLYDSRGARMTPHGYGEPARREGKGFKAARFALGVLVARGSGMGNAAEWCERTFGDKEVAKALNTTGVSTGGALIPQYFSNDIIELLRAMTVIRKCEPTTIEMPGGNMTIPRLAAGATAGYQGELDDMSASQETFDDLQLNAKKLTALVPISNDLIRRASNDIEQIVRDDMLQSLARREDLAFLLGDGSGNSPIGLLNLCQAANKMMVTPFTATDNTTILTAVASVLQSMVLQLTLNFSRMIRPRWICSPTVKAFLQTLRDGVGNFIYASQIDNDQLLGIPIMMTQQLPTNITANVNGGGTANDGTYLFLADFADVILAETYRMVVDASDVASYKDSGGNMVSTFTRDQTAFRIIEEHDFNMRHLGSVVVALLPQWAPAGFSNFGPGGAYFVQPLSTDMSAAPSTWGSQAPTGSSNPGNSSANVPGGTQIGIS